MDIVKKYEKTINSNNRVMTVDAIHGVNVYETVIEPLMNLYSNKGVKVLASGVEQERILDHYDVDYERITDFYELKKKESGMQYELKENDTTADLTFIWSSNFTGVEHIHEIKRNFKTSVVDIGDSFLVDYFSNGDVIKHIRNCDLYLDKINKLPKYSQELVYFANRIRNGTMEELENINNRSYVVSDKKPELEEIFDYDVAVVSKFYVGDTNKKIRSYIFDYHGAEPRKGERMIAYQPIKTKDSKGNEIEIQLGEELIVKDARMNNDGCFYGVFDFKGKEVELWIDMNFINVLYGLDYDEYMAGGVRLYYSYVIPPKMVVDKSYDTLFFEMKNNDINNKRVFYSVARAARRDIKVVYDSDNRFVY